MIVGNFNTDNQLKKYERGQREEQLFQSNYVHVIKHPNFIQEGDNWGHLLIFSNTKGVRKFIEDYLNSENIPYRGHREM